MKVMYDEPKEKASINSKLLTLFKMLKSGGACVSNQNILNAFKKKLCL